MPRLAAAFCALLFACTGDDVTDLDTSISNRGAALDAHVHVMSQPLMDAVTGGGVRAPGADDIVARLDEARTQRAVVLSYAYLNEFPDADAARAEQEYTAAQVARFPDRLVGFCGIHPLREGAVAEIDRCVDELAMAGVKIHLANGMVDLRLPDHVAALAAVLDRATERGLPVLMHSGAPLGLPLDSDAFLNLGGLIAQRPALRLTLAHCTNASDPSEMEVWLSGLQNGFFNPDTLYVDTSSCLEFYKDAPRAQKELIVWRMREWGISNVLFGSDYDFIVPETNPAGALETLRSYPFTKGELATILSNTGSAWLGE